MTHIQSPEMTARPPTTTRKQLGVKSRLSRTGTSLLPKLLFIVFAVLAWSLVAGLQDTSLFPTPWGTAREIGDIISDGSLVANLIPSILRVVIGLAVTFSLALAIGVCMGRLKFFERFLEIGILVGLTIPGLAWALIGILYFGISEITPIFAVVVTTTPLLVLNFWEGTKHLDDDLLEMSRIFAFSRTTILRHVIIPQLTPYMMSALRLGLSVSWKVIVIAELFGMPNGLGRQISIAYNSFNMSGVVAWTFAFAAVMFISEYAVIGVIERRVTRWKRGSS